MLEDGTGVIHLIGNCLFQEVFNILAGYWNEGCYNNN